MASAWQDLEYGLAAAAAAAEPKPLLELQRAIRPPRPETMLIGFRTVDGVRVRIAESEGPAEFTILLTSPWPESVYAFAPIWASLAARFRLFAVDLPGFGASERRADLLSPRAMGGFLVRLIDECDLGRPHIVGPDIGTSAALFAAASSPGSVASVVVGSGAAAVPIELGEPLRSWVLDPDLDGLRSMDPTAVVGAALDTVKGHAVPPAIREDYLASYAGERFFESMRYVRRYPGELPILAERLQDIETPVLIVAGLRDRVVPLANAEFLAARLPRSRLTTIDAGHFIWEEAPDDFAALVSNWVSEGHHTTQTTEVNMSSTQLSSDVATDGTRAAAVPMRFEVAVLPVADVDRAKAFYQGLGWRLDADVTIDEHYGVVQVTPPGSPASIIFGNGTTTMAPGSVQDLMLIVEDIDAAREELIAHGVDVSEVWHDETGIFHHAGTEGRVPGPDPQGNSYGSWASFSDPDGNGWLLQEIKERLPGR